MVSLVGSLDIERLDFIRPVLELGVGGEMKETLQRCALLRRPPPRLPISDANYLQTSLFSSKMLSDFFRTCLRAIQQQLFIPQCISFIS